MGMVEEVRARSKRNPAQPANDDFLGFTSSIPFDSRLWKYDIAGSIAHVRGLASAGVITANERMLMINGLRSIAKDIMRGMVAFDPKFEDLHMNIEGLLTNKAGAAGAKLHTGRSRNDQVALDVRLFVREALSEVALEAVGLQEILLKKAKESSAAILPGLTHMQHAQPILLSHHLLAHFWRLKRDIARIFDCYQRTNISPLGSGALAGTSFKIDRNLVAGMLGMDGVTENSMDAVSDRDFVAEAAFTLSLLQIHLSSLSEELVLWSSMEFGYIKLPRQLAGGSSMMPQKLNPDIPELVRGKSGRAIGDLVAVLTLLKSLPLAYNRDLQEDKESLFDVFDTVGASLHALKTFLAEVEFDKARMRKAAEVGLMTATDLADLLTTQGVPFRDAHKTVKGLAKQAEGDDERFLALADDLLSKSLKGLGISGMDYLGIDEAVERRSIDGGTSMSAVTKQIGQADSALQAAKESLSDMRKDISAVDKLLG
jgi:argininosuccinate lyase